ncbi:MAG: tetratricopeptide repeat protein [Gammaproteobacteria bacterium]|nr:tetratricopeptide repeat protein [Gammaproteobacteria bacterium]
MRPAPPTTVVTMLATVAALGLLCAPAPRADQTDARLDDLFAELAAADDPHDAFVTEMAIWRVWGESGRDDVDALLALGTEAMAGGRLDDAIAIFDRVVAIAPGFAEGWNKRATAYYLRGDYVASVRDIERTLALEPRHFGAISGMGLIFLERGDETGALKAFEEVLKIHPMSSNARRRVEELRERLPRRGA